MKTSIESVASIVFAKTPQWIRDDRGAAL